MKRVAMAASDTEKDMESKFILKTEITGTAKVEDFLKAETLTSSDLILTNKFLFDAHFDPTLCSAQVLYQERYGSGEPTDEMIDHLRADMNHDCTRIIAIGGGTVLDIAKLLTLEFEGTTEDLIQGRAAFKKARKLIAVPTTCGTGSEVTNVAITELKRLNTKKGLATPLLYPDKAYLISEMIESLPYKVFATSSIDALIHACESYLSPKADCYSRMFSIQAIKMILRGYLKTVEEGKESWIKHAEDFLVASNLAGIAFSNAGCAAVHALSYPLSGAYHVPHGEANQCMFEAVFRKYEEKDAEGELRSFKALIGEELQTNADQSLDALFALMNQVLARNPLCHYGVKKEELAVFTKSVIEGQQRLLNNNYTELSAEDMMAIYNSVYEN